MVTHLSRKYPHYRIVVLDKLDYCSSKEHLRELQGSDNFRFVQGNILSADLVAYILRQEQIDTIMHFAASTHVDNSFNSSISFTENNVMGSHTLLECARMYGGVRRYIHVSTDEVYGGDTLMNTEDSTMAPTNPYACSKAAAEFLCRGYLKSFNMPIIMTRGNNVYGPRQFPDKLIPKSVCLLAANRSCFIHGDGSHSRNFLFAEDAARAFDTVLHKGKVGEVYNVGSPYEKTTSEVIHDLIRLFGKEGQEEFYITHVHDRAFNDTRYSIDSSKLHSLGWKPLVDWEEGLKKTKDWYCDPANLARWPNYQSGLTAHPSLDSHAKVFTNVTDRPKSPTPSPSKGYKPVKPADK